MKPWRRNVYTVAIAQFITLNSGNRVFPFMLFVTDPAAGQVPAFAPAEAVD